MLKFSGSSCVNQVQGKVPVYVKETSDTHFGELGQVSVYYTDMPALEVLPDNRAIHGIRQRSRASRAGDGVR